MSKVYSQANPMPIKKTQTKRAPRHSHVKDEACGHKTYFTVDQALMIVLQSVTGKQTHEIMNELVFIYEGMIRDYEIDLAKKSSGAKWIYNMWKPRGKSKRRTDKFPGTDIYVTCNLLVDYKGTKHDEYKEDASSYWGTKKKPENCTKCDANTLLVRANFYMPQVKKLMPQEEINEIILEGELFDVSHDIEDIKVNDTLTPAEKREKQEKQEREKRERILNNKITTITNKLKSGKELTKNQKQDYLDLIDKGLMEVVETDSNKP